MGLYQFLCQQQLGNVTVILRSAYKMRGYETTVAFDSTTGPFTVNLPPIAAAVGESYSFRRVVGSSIVTLTHAGDAAGFVNVSFNNNGDKAILLCDGRGWFILEQGTT